MVCFLLLSIIKFPQETFDAARDGVDTWINIVFPSLLPFFIGSELLIELGVVNFIGVLLEPVIRPIFNVPGEGSFIFAMSVTSGYPVGVKLITKLRNEHVFTKGEGKRLLSFCSTSGPLFMIGAVSIGMFHNLQLGTIIAIAHYLGGIATGICFRFYKYKEEHFLPQKQQQGYITRAFHELFKNLESQEKTLGSLLGSCIKNSVEALLVIGGFIILFSVIIRLLIIIGFIGYISNIFQSVNLFSIIDNRAMDAIISGIFEMTIGCKLLSEIQGLSFLQQAVFSTILISWSGLSIHAQSASLICKTDLSNGIYIFSKLLHAIFSGIFVFMILAFSNVIFYSLHTPVFYNYSSSITLPSFSKRILFSSELFIIVTLIIILTSMILSASLLIGRIIKKLNK